MNYLNPFSQDLDVFEVETAKRMVDMLTGDQNLEDLFDGFDLDDASEVDRDGLQMAH